MAYSEPSGPNSWRVRFQKPDGTLGSVSGFTSKADADEHAQEIDVDRRRGQFIDPDGGRTPLGAWAADWFDALDVAPNTDRQYRSLWRNHLEPDWGMTPLVAITNLSVHKWAKGKRAENYATSTVSTMVKLLSMMLSDAADEKLIHANPYRANRRGRRRHAVVRERVYTSPEGALRLALHATVLAGWWAGALLITAAWTGARWGELLGMRRSNLHLDGPVGKMVIDPNEGALLEIDGVFSLGPPKTAESARTIILPPFLTALLRQHLATHNHTHVFVTAEEQHPRRSNFSRRVMRPAADGTRGYPQHWPHLTPVQPDLTFHGLRHSHKTWMIADLIPDIAQAKRLGHRLPDKIEHIYSHVAPEVEARLLDNLERRWLDAVREVTATERHHTERISNLGQITSNEDNL
ncbi:Integrase [Alloactinosynnema sp. L-07]|uniref:tyrosine-type recombinase/integrase n=1 Tax=Alloactinosynnema sp. L-07 TaxID=1653480 RepID=UPI00065EEF83|nr:tyrosine-type recombinase/integrase [Alloactinosynnema sp. L-07]CRK57596.1 Integrase [Alloactinosynnema sp. L-07]